MNYPKDYASAISEFEALDDDHREPYLFAFPGYALYLSQHFEKLLMNIIWAHKIVNRKNKTSEELNLIFDEYEFGRKTMGVLIWEVRNILNLPQAETNKLELLLKRRNYFVHKYFKVNNNLMYTAQGYKIIIKDFLTFINDINSFEPEMQKYLDRYVEKLGYSKEQIQKEIEAETKQWAQAQVGDSY